MLNTFISVLDDVEVQLAFRLVVDGDQHIPLMYIDGNSFSKVDCLLSVIIHRLYWLGYSKFLGQERPCLSIWWGNVKQKQSIQNSTHVPLLNFQMLKRKLYENKLKVSAILGIFAVFAFGYKYMNHRRPARTVTRYIILEKLL